MAASRAAVTASVTLPFKLREQTSFVAVLTTAGDPVRKIARKSTARFQGSRADAGEHSLPAWSDH
jgi:hypothetical protein